MLNLHEIESYSLGKTNRLINLEKRSENIAVANHMAKQCRNSLHIISRQLDPSVLDTKEFCDTIQSIVLQRQRIRIQIMIFEVGFIVKYRHGLATLAKKLTSFIELRKGPKSFADYNEHIMITDIEGYIYRGNGTRYEGKSNFNDRRHCRNLLAQFTDIWEQATPDVNLRRLSL